ncbi:amidohydrolase family protein [Aquimarina mytili]|uniref:Amidohydrolase family protein n=1 Tax=Aquimarina mytili TaxID=874423 RepID=A0A936ZV14_9FLAO|nr:amidohydrolase family protein [Aquimarina mytili]MBL0684832.1 amidohydrolase family protein [Aquimarina mytili]
MLRLGIVYIVYGLLCIYNYSEIYAQTQSITFENVNVIPMHEEVVLKNQRVIIKNGMISKIESALIEPTQQTDIIIPAKGKFLIPGLTEMHYHLENDVRDEFKLLVANGVTAVRNMAEYEGQDQIMIREQANNHKFLSPYYVTTGPYLKIHDLQTEEEVVAVVKKHHDRGYDYLKIADNLPENIYVKLLKETSKYNIPVVGHGQRKLPLEYSLRMKSIAHVEEFMYILNSKQKEDTSYLKQVADMIKTSGVYVSPTLGVFEMISRYADDKKFAVLKKSDQIKYRPRAYAAYCLSDTTHYRSNTWFTAPESLIRLEKELEWQKGFTKILHDAKVPLIAGSDTYGLFLPGFSLHRELELICNSGLSPYEALKTATVNPARYLNRASISGTITTGKLADLVLLNKNPLQNISNTQTIEGVVIHGKWLSKEGLNKMLKEVEEHCKTEEE